MSDVCLTREKESARCTGFVADKSILSDGIVDA
jgi:hypothetical protein